jgi:hypothetical protein
MRTREYGREAWRGCGWRMLKNEMKNAALKAAFDGGRLMILP